MKAAFSILVAVITVLLLAMGAVSAGGPSAQLNTPDGAVRALFDHVRNHDWNGAYALVADQNKVDQNDFVRDLSGRNGDLRTFSSLAKVSTKVLNQSDSSANVRTDLQWSSAVGAIYQTLDLRTVRDGSGWKVVWTTEKPPEVPPQVIPVNFLRWDIVTRGAEDDWGAQNVEAPRVRVISMNAVSHDGGTVILGELVNEDTVPGFVSVEATLLGKDGSTLGQESSFDKISHVLLPKEVSPFRIDFPGVRLDRVNKVRMNPTALLVPASADPVIGVLHQRLEPDATGRKVLKGELINESGQIVNIPHVLATFYDDQGKVIWVTDGYVDQALLPQSPEPFQLALRDDIASKVHSYRVTVNQYSINRQQS